MGRLKSDQQEKFAQLVVEGYNQSEAYREAYPRSKKWKSTTVHVKVSELMRNGKVSVKIKELREEHYKRHEVTVDSLVADLMKVRDISLSEKTFIKQRRVKNPRYSAGDENDEPEFLIKEERARTLNLATANTAIMSMAKLLGFDVQKHEIDGGGFEFVFRQATYEDRERMADDE